MSVQQQFGQVSFAFCVCMYSKIAVMCSSQHMTCGCAELLMQMCVSRLSQLQVQVRPGRNIITGLTASGYVQAVCAFPLSAA